MIGKRGCTNRLEDWGGQGGQKILLAIWLGSDEEVTCGCTRVTCPQLPKFLLMCQLLSSFCLQELLMLESNLGIVVELLLLLLNLLASQFSWLVPLCSRRPEWRLVGWVARA